MGEMREGGLSSLKHFPLERLGCSAGRTLGVELMVSSLSLITGGVIEWGQ